MSTETKRYEHEIWQTVPDRETKMLWGSDREPVREGLRLLLRDGRDITYTNFHKASLINMMFSYSGKQRDLTGCNFSEANLVGCDFRECILEDANFADASIAHTVGLRLIEGGCRSDLTRTTSGELETRQEWRFYLSDFEGEGIRVRAGCRNYTLEQAYNHRWAKDNDPESLWIIKNLIERARRFFLWDIPSNPFDTI